jgi:hypothetical protein
MKKTYSSGVAFIFEGDTEQTFYEILISQFRGKHPEYSYSVSFDDIVNEVISESSCGSYSVIIRMNSVKTITQVAHSADWFNNSCKKNILVSNGPSFYAMTPTPILLISQNSMKGTGSPYGGS